jgi:hypothetical protein
MICALLGHPLGPKFLDPEAWKQGRDEPWRRCLCGARRVTWRSFMPLRTQTGGGLKIQSFERASERELDRPTFQRAQS